MLDVVEICERLGSSLQDGDYASIDEVLKKYRIEFESQEFISQMREIESAAEAASARAITHFLAGFITGLDYASIFNQEEKLNFED